MFFRYKKFTKALTLIVSALFVLQMAWPALVAGLPASAQYTDPTRVAMEVEKKVETIGDKIEEGVTKQLFKGMILTVSVSIKNLLIKMARKAAEQAVTYMSSGSWGEGSMFYEQAYEDFTANLEEQMVGQFLDNMSELLGKDICSPSLPFEMNLKLGLQLKYADIGYDQLKKPNCTLKALTTNWEAFADNINEKYKSAIKEMKNPGAQSLALLQETFDASFTPSKSDLGIALSAESSLLELRDKKVTGAEKQRQEDQGTKGLTNLTEAMIKTPSFLVRSHSEGELEASKKTMSTEVDMATNVVTEIPGQVAMAFLNTFVSQFWQQMIMDKYFKKGLVDSTKAYNPEQRVMETKQVTAAEFASVKMNFAFSQKQIDLLTEYSSCPQDRQLNNCVMDTAFADAVRSASQDRPLTVAQALASGDLVGNRPLVGPNDDKQKSDDCYATAYCYSNLVKLRKARIIPIGWELAALKVEPGSNVTLQNAIDGFTDANSPFYHLIDPNWALRYPQTQCKALASGPLLVAEDTSDRAEYCADLQSCIRMNDQGQCEAFGYCAAEKNIFRFGGTECNGAYDSCRALKDDKGKEVAYLFNTIDQKFCDSGNVGCAWYSTAKTAAGQWLSNADKRIYLNKNIFSLSCKPGEEGCTRMVRTAGGLGTNLIVNGGFEMQAASDADIAADMPVAVPGWENGDVSVDANDGKYSLIVYDGDYLLTNEIYFPPKFYTRYFVVSAYVRTASGAPKVTLMMKSTDVNFNNAFSVLAPLPDAMKPVSDEWTRVYKIIQLLPPNLGQGILSGGNVAVELAVEGGNALIDQVMLEEIDSPFIDAMHEYTDYATQNVTYLKKAPGYLACYNVKKALNAPHLDGRPNFKDQIEDTDDAKSTDTIKGCDKFARICTASEVGCNSYKPADDGSTIYGVASYSDYCPQECVGYESYAQSPTFFELGAFPLYFIPSTGNACGSAEAGCEEFTNLDELAKGGEAKEYYIEPKLCAKLPDSAAQCETYYTWESKDVTGYKLQSYVLQKGAAGEPKLIHDSYENSCTQNIYLTKTNPDCRQFFNKAGKAFYSLASKTITCSTDCHPYRRTLLFDSEQLCAARQGQWKNGECLFMIIPNEGKKCGAANAGCREYKGNQSGVERLLENYTFSPTDNGTGPLEEFTYGVAKAMTTVEFGPVLQVEVKDGEAMLFTKPEKTVLENSDEYRLSFFIRLNDSKTAGKFKAQLRDGNVVKYGLGEASLGTDWQQFNFEIKPQWLGESSLSVGISANQAFQIDNFKIARVADYEYLIKNSWVTPKSCDYKLNAELNDANNSLPQGMLGCREFVDKDNVKHYLKSFSGLCAPDKVGCEAVIDTQNNAWPVEKDYKTEVSMDRLCYEFAAEWPKINGETATNDAYNKQPAGAAVASTLPSVRCWIPAKGEADGKLETYYPFGNKDTQKKELCGSLDYVWDANKCYEIQANVPNDRLVYLVLNKSVTCDADAKGCTALGLPGLTVDTNGQTVVKKAKNKKTGAEEEVWSNQFYKLDWDLAEGSALNSPFCNRAEAGCREYKDEKGAALYFKDPGDKVCEYRKVTNPGGTDAAYGWYRKKLDSKAPDEACVAEDYYNTGVQNLIMNADREDNVGTPNVSETYAGWVGVCPKGADKCTAFVDPTDVGKSPLGRPYYFINDGKIDQGGCSKVNRKQGCALFYDTSKADANAGGALGFAGANYLAFETYINSNSTAKAADPVQAAEQSKVYKFEQCISMPPVKTCPTSNLSQDAIKILQGFNTTEQCLNFTYCSFMADCIAKENSLDTCYDRVEETDLLPATGTKEFNCANMDLSKTPAENAVSLQSLSGALTNAYCTVRQIMKPNANTIIKVMQDRDCAEWYACQSSHWDWDSATGKYVESCDRVGLCDKLDPGKESAKCQRFVSEENADDLLTQNKVIADGYGARSTGWYAFDYSGYVIPQIAPIQFYNAFDVNQKAGKKTCGAQPDGKPCTVDNDCGASGKKCGVVVDYRLANQSGLECDFTYECNGGQGNEDKKALYDAYCQAPDGTDAKGDPKYKYVCRCLGNVCVRPFAPEKTFDTSEAPACRAYPEKSSPFPSYVKDTRKYANAKLLYAPESDKNKLDLACHYQKVTYGGGAITKYYPRSPLYSPALADGYCQDDSEKSCGCDNPPADPQNGQVVINSKTMCSSMKCAGGSNPVFGNCYRKDKIVEYSGWEGYCLERDSSISLFNESDKHPCLTWYPAQRLPGLMDSNNDYDSAGFNPAGYGFSGDNLYYCRKSDRWEYREAFEVHSLGWFDCDGDQENGVIVIPRDLSEIDTAGGLAGEWTTWAMNEKYGNGLVCKETADWPTNADKIKYENEDYCILSSGGGDKEKGVCYSETADPLSLWKCLKNHCDNGVDNGSTLGNPQKVCPPGYRAALLHEVDQNSEDKEDYEDKLVFAYECQPLLPNGNPVKSGWFYDPDGKLDAVAGYDVVAKQSTEIKNELEEYGCDEFVSAVEAGKSKAFTNVVYQGEVTIDSCDGQPIVKTASCQKDQGPYGALGYSSEIQSVEPKNVFVGEECTDSGGGEKCVRETGLRTLFAKAYTFFTHQSPVLKVASGQCVSSNVEINKRSCATNQECNEQAGTSLADCWPFKLGQCAKFGAGEIADGKNKYCYTDTDCGANQPYSLDDEYYAKLDYCTDAYPVAMTKIDFPNKVCPLGGDYEEKYEGDKDSDDICRKYFWVALGEDGGSCKKGDPPKSVAKVGGNVPEGTYCTADPNKGLKWPSDVSSWAQGITKKLYSKESGQKVWDSSPEKAKATPPMVAGIESAGKADSSGKPMSVALPHKITITTPTASLSAGDIIGEGGQLEVMAKFYAWAHDDQMPLTQVKVYWGNGGTPSGGDGAKYQNHKPRCQRTAGEELMHCSYLDNQTLAWTGLACSSDDDCIGFKNLYPSQSPGCVSPTDSFGDTADKSNNRANACLEGYFSFSNTYTCSAADLALSEPCGAPDKQYDKYGTPEKQSCIAKLEDGRTACRFRPAVQVMDNWEWCNANHDEKGVVVDVKDGKTVLGQDGYWGTDCGEIGGMTNAKEFFDGFIYVIP